MGSVSTRCLALSIALCCCGVDAQAYTITSFGPSVYTGSDATAQAAMDATLGLTGALIEDFEDTNLVSGMTVEFSGNPEATSVPSGNLIVRPDSAWDGTTVFNANPFGDDVIFRYSSGADRAAIGIGDAEGNLAANRISVNGVDLGRIDLLPGFVGTDNQRQVYVVIQRDTGDAAITSLSIFQQTSPTQSDGLHLDHVAFAQETAVPEPGALLVALLLSVSCAGALRRGRAQ